MTRSEVLLLLEEIIEIEPGTLSSAQCLKDYQSWDSMAAIVFLAEADEKLGIQVEPVALARCKTFDDLIDLLGDKVTVA